MSLITTRAIFFCRVVTYRESQLENTPPEIIDTLVIGAGVVGLAVAREMAMVGHEVIIVESNKAIGQEISARNSEVIHAGLYYPTNSLKAKLCVEGNRLLYQYCQQRQIPHQRIGKLIVAQPQQQRQLEQLAVQAKANGVNVTMLDQQQVAALEPELTCQSALFSPDTGIIDCHSLMQSLLADAQAHGAVLALDNHIDSGHIDLEGDPEAITLTLADHSIIKARQVINCAGLNAVHLANTLLGEEPAVNTSPPLPRAYLAKGNYFKLTGRPPFNHLIYPLPEPGGLGIHLTLDLAGQARFGPDVQWITTPDYRVDPQRAGVFYDAIRHYWPALPDDRLVADYAGIRPKITPQGTPAEDFRIDDHRFGHQGQLRLVNLLGIESPGLTASLALAYYVRSIKGQVSP